MPTTLPLPSTNTSRTDATVSNKNPVVPFNLSALDFFDLLHVDRHHHGNCAAGPGTFDSIYINNIHLCRGIATVHLHLHIFLAPIVGASTINDDRWCHER
jgi:hypothetical protein